ncbi:MAG: CshA/CshB family fibrillar adhesin-related protein [Streptococcus sp.]
MQFEVSATFRGKVVKPAIVMADGESANPGELVMFTTNGRRMATNWRVEKDYGKHGLVTFIPQDTDNLFGPNPTTTIKWNNHSTESTLTNFEVLTQAGPDKKPVAWKYFGSA